ncbi:hypothetical protein BDAP_002871 [Binucleata daphniae]
MVDKNHDSSNHQTCVNTKPIYNAKEFDDHIILMNKYFIKNKFDTLEEMISIDYLNNILKWIEDQNKDNNIEIDEKIVEQILTYVKIEKSLQAKTKFLANAKYYDLDEKTEEYETSEQHKDVIKRLNIEETIPNYYRLNISAYCMYDDDTLKDTRDIIININYNIKTLVVDLDTMTERLFNIIKKILCKRVNSYMFSLGFVLAKSICDQINEIKTPIVKNVIDKSKQTTAENIIEDFFGEIMKIINKTEEPTILCEKVNSIKNKLQIVIFPNYTKIIETVKELFSKIEENIKMSADLYKYMLKIDDYTEEIGRKYERNEDTYLDLDTIIDKNNEDINLKNKRKLCELQIIDMIEKVISYRRMIINTENSMLELINEIEKLKDKGWCETLKMVLLNE